MLTPLSQSEIEAISLPDLQSEGATFIRLNGEGGKQATQDEIDAILAGDYENITHAWQAEDSGDFDGLQGELDGEHGTTDEQVENEGKPTVIQVIIGLIVFLFVLYHAM